MLSEFSFVPAIENIECLYAHLLDGAYTFTYHSDFHKNQVEGG